MSSGSVKNVVLVPGGFVDGSGGPPPAADCHERPAGYDKAFRNGRGGPHPDREAAPRRALHRAVPRGSG
jgi:hypothetical protein